MKKLLAIGSLCLLAGCSVGGVELTKNAVSCEYDEMMFAPGETVELADGCNSCVCSTEGQLENCTAKDCAELTGLANPAAVKCSVDGFKNEIRTADDGSQSGVCIDKAGKECDDWAYFRGECKLGKPKVETENSVETQTDTNSTEQNSDAAVDTKVENSTSENPATPAE
ncbi:MAG: DUF333 domain-containing protein [Patescibacteria group bacterium]